MNPLADEFESWLTRRVFKGISAFFTALIIFMTLLNLRLGMLTNLENSARMLVRTVTMVFDIAVCLWAFRSKASDKVFLRVPPVFLLVNFVGTVFVTVSGNADPLVAIGSYIVQTNLYILTFSFFVRRQGLTLVFGGFLLGIGYLLFGVFYRGAIAPAVDRAAIMRVYSHMMTFGVIQTTVLVAFSNKFFAVLLAKVHAHVEEMALLAFTDRETGLPNAQQLSKDIAEWSQNPERAERPCVMIGFRLEGLETINETHSIDFANALLRELVLRYKTALSAFMDEKTLIRRLDGFAPLYRVESNTFAYLIEIPESEFFNPNRASLLQATIDGMCLEYRERIALSFRGGLSAYPQDAPTLEQLLKNLLNLVHAKRGESLGVFSPFNMERYQLFLREQNIKAAMANAIEQGEFALVFQPKVSTSTGRALGFEALARWKNGEFGQISPGEFIPLAEESGNISALTEHLLEYALDFAAQLALNDLRIPVSINLSPGTVRPDFLNIIGERIAASGLGGMIEFEITEGIVMKMTTEIADDFRKLKTLGITFSIDDFGTGYSNLGYLQSFEAQVLKIDKSFIDGIPLDAKNATLVQTIIRMGKSFGMKIVAEGVEYAEQRDFLARFDCDMIQGYFYSKPLEVPDALAYALAHGEPG
jgi:EAL domain-containing protein (putative c-di-GMP-specific phosphodiesterase class I)/GGDEF domain-containing protein